MKKLFNVAIENEVCAMGEDKDDAENVARHGFKNEDDRNFAFFATEVTPLYPYINPDEVDCIPYGSIDNKTCNEIIKEMQEAEELKKIRAEADKKQLKFGFYKNINAKK